MLLKLFSTIDHALLVKCKKMKIIDVKKLLKLDEDRKKCTSSF